MNLYNETRLIGRVFKDIRYSINGNNEVVNFTVSTRRTYKNKDGTTTHDYHDCTAWGELAKHINEYFGEGKAIIVLGESRKNKYEKDGQTFWRSFVNVSNIGFSLRDFDQINQTQ